MIEVDSQIQALARGESQMDEPDLRVKLDEYGLDYKGTNSKITLCETLELLDVDVINGAMNDEARKLLSSLELRWSLDSTNTFLLNRPDDQGFHGVACTAERQTAGRGRRGRSWVSPFGTNIYLSLGWLFPSSVSLDGLSLAIGCCVTRAIRAHSHTVDVKLKWPNDLLLDGGKTAGILVELGAGSNDLRKVVVGVGINLNMSSKASESIDQPWSVVSGVSRNRLIASLLSELALGLQIFGQNGFSVFREEWNQIDAYKDREATLLSAQDSTDGICRGVDSAGCLQFEVGGVVRSVNAGEISLRPRAI